MQLRCHVVQFVLGDVIMTTTQAQPQCLHDMSHEIQLLFSIKNICIVAVVRQFV